MDVVAFPKWLRHAVNSGGGKPAKRCAMIPLRIILPAALVLVLATQQSAVAMPGDQLRSAVGHYLLTAGVGEPDLSRLSTGELTRLIFIFEDGASQGNKRLLARTYLRQIGG
ncbi:hypothetical protein SAMN04488020_11550 [Palleronia marisminoris]|uniref:Uncharacterized protein n=1 Tax=Palleronia marisminoris TaxID=315423 RepID=A0A1Y5TNR0_9RHOB|nr:hypothetical protein SAMN04488020_11550 [Palleronia marisminoris]SLN68327.1 hypothetical protein PAM7066_03446 [Palleronia marisminoris]